VTDQAATANPPERISPGLSPLLVPIASLALDPKNARLHSARNIGAIKDSLVEYGQLKPVVVRDGVVIAGNGTVTAALALGWERIAAVDAKELTLSQARAFGIMDNKSAELAEWDFQVLADHFREMEEDLRVHTGFEDFEMEPLLEADWTPGAPTKTDYSEHVIFTVSARQAKRIQRAIKKTGEQEVGDALVEIATFYLDGN
jgi:hypothetical protein